MLVLLPIVRSSCTFCRSDWGENTIFSKDNDNHLWEIQLDKQIVRDTQIQLQPDKQKLFFLNGRAGIDLLDSIEKQINELSSEYRLMPSPDKLDKSTAAKVLSATGKDGESADTLRSADRLTIPAIGLGSSIASCRNPSSRFAPTGMGKATKRILSICS